MALLVDTVVPVKGLRPTVTFREDIGGGIIYNASSRRFLRTNYEEIQTLERLAQNVDNVWLSESMKDALTKAGLIGPDNTTCSFSKKPSRTIEHPFRPVHSLVIATLDCNAKCRFCSASPYMRSYKGNKLKSKSNAKLLAQKLYTLGVMQCVISGGEPTLSPYLPYLIKSLIRYSIFPTVVSNGTIWSSAEYIENSEEGVHWVLSYHSDIPDEHDSILGVYGAHKKVSKVIRDLNLLGVPSRINVVIGEYNQQRIDSIIRSASNLGVQDVLLSQYLCMDRSRDQSLPPSTLVKIAETVSYWRDRGVKIATGHRFRFMFETGSTFIKMLFPDFEGGCNAGLYESLVFPDGSVHPCDYLWEKKFCAGNLFDDGGVERISNSPVFFMLHNLKPDNICLKCYFLRVCKGGCPGVRYMLEGNLAYPNPECPLLEDTV